MSSLALWRAIGETLESLQAATDLDSLTAAMGNTLAAHDFTCGILEIHADKTFSVRYASSPPELIEAVRKISGLDVLSYSGPLDRISFMRKVVHTRRATYVDDLAFVVLDALGFPGARPIATRVRAAFKSPEMIAAPLFIDDEVAGVLAIRGLEALTPEDIPLVNVLAAGISARWQAFKAQVIASEQIDPFRLMRQIGSEAAAFPDPSQLIYRVLHRLHAAIPGDYASIGLIEGDHIVVKFESFKDKSYDPPSSPGMLRLRVGQEGMMGHVAGQGETLLANDVRREARHVPNPRMPDTRSEVALPLRHRGETIGVLNVEADEVAAFKTHHIELLETAAAQLAAIIATTQLRERLDRETDALTTLVLTVEALTASLPLNERLTRIVEHACQMVEATGAMLHLVEGDGSQQKLTELISLNVSTAAPMATKLAEETFRNSQRADIIADGTSTNGNEGNTGDASNLFSLPLRLNNESLGALTLVRAAQSPFSEEDRRGLAPIANLAAAAVSSARLADQNERQRQLAETLNLVSRVVGSSLDLEEILDAILSALKEVIDYSSTSIMLFKGSTLDIAAARSMTNEEFASFKEANWEMLPTVRQVIAQRRPYIIPDTDYEETWRVLDGTDYIKSWIGVPLISRGNMIGILNVNSDQPNHYQPTDGSYLVPFANQIATALDNALLFGQSQTRQVEARALYEATRVMVSTGDTDTMIRDVLASIHEVIPYDVSALLIAREGVSEEPYYVEVHAPEAVDDILQGLARQHIAEQYRVQSTSLSSRREERQDVVGDMTSAHDARLPARLSAPLLRGDRTLGLIELSSTSPNAYDESDLRLLFTIANPLATALENASLIQALRQRADELEEADRLKDEVVQNISHELRNPLTFVRGYVQLLLDGDLGTLNDDQIKSLTVVSRKTDGLVRLVNDIVTLNGVAAETLAREPSDIGHLVAESVRGVEANASMNRMIVAVELPSTPQVVDVDPHRITQVIDNLLGNALKFSDEGGRIVVRVIDMEERVRVEVEDEGEGVAAEMQERIFERFFQGHAGLTRRQGAGLGLAISKQIMDAHRGAIGVESEPGQGSTFYFELRKATI